MSLSSWSIYLIFCLRVLILFFVSVSIFLKKVLSFGYLLTSVFDVCFYEDELLYKNMFQYKTTPKWFS